MKQLQWANLADALGVRSLTCANVTVYPDSHQACIAGKTVHCTGVQFRYLVTLLSNFCRTVAHRDLTGTNGALSSREHNTLKVQLSYLRRVLREHGAEIEIRTVLGAGYQARPSERARQSQKSRYRVAAAASRARSMRSNASRMPMNASP